ncbi:MAG: hypothetical protein R3E89_05145 [Thiolinea sp.]
MFDVWTLLLFGVGGYLASKIGIERNRPADRFHPRWTGGNLFRQIAGIPFSSTDHFLHQSPIAVGLWVLITISHWFLGIRPKKTPSDAAGESAP